MKLPDLIRYGANILLPTVNAGFPQICNSVDGVLVAYVNYNKSNGLHAILYTPLSTGMASHASNTLQHPPHSIRRL
jgi:hypothetical protein